MQMIWMRNTNVINTLKGHHQSQVKLLKIKLFMKVVKKAIYVAVALFCLNLTVSAQDITLKVSNITVKQAMDELKSRSGYSFVFSSADVDTGKKVSVSAENQSVDAVIEQILRGQELTYEIRDKNVIIRKKTSSIKETSKKAIEVIGTVLDSKGVPIIGANVVIKGTTNGTISDFDGNFSIQNIPANAVLIVSYIGYVDKEIAVGDESVIKVILSEDMQALDEVVVVGYGTMKKSDLTGSISNVKSDKKLVVIKSDLEQIETGLKKIGAMLGDYVEVGCNSVLNPGTVLGPNVNVYPTSSVRGYVPAAHIFKAQDRIVKKEA